MAFIHLHKNQRTKLDPCAVRCLFLGYALHKKGYRCYDPTANRTNITMDVTLFESDTFFESPVSNSALQGERKDEEQNWLGVHWWTGCEMSSGVDMTPRAETENAEIKETENAEIEPNVVEIEDAETKNVKPKNEEPVNAELGNKSPHSLVPKDPPPENILEVSSLITPSHTNALDTPVDYALPFRRNCGKPLNRYSPDEEERRSKFPIANYVSTQSLSEPLKTFTQKLSSCHIPNSFEEALSDTNWAQAIQEELEALQKNNTWKLVSLPEGNKIVGVQIGVLY